MQVVVDNMDALLDEEMQDAQPSKGTPVGGGASADGGGRADALLDYADYEADPCQDMPAEFTERMREAQSDAMELVLLALHAPEATGPSRGVPPALVLVFDHST